MKLIDRLSLQRAIKMLFNFILALVDKFKKTEQEPEKKKRRWRKKDE